MKNRCSYVLIFTSLCLTFLSCKNSTAPAFPDKNVIYYTSFEKEADLKGWELINSQNLYNEACPDGGKKSVYIGGGCVVPHARIELKSPGMDLNVSIEFWGKDLQIGGVVEVDVVGVGNQDEVFSIQDSTWTKFNSTQNLFWQKDSVLRIRMNSGGFLSSAMLIDELKIIKIVE